MVKLSSILFVSGMIFMSCNNASNSNETANDSTMVDSGFVAEEVLFVMPPAEENKVAGVHMNKKHHEAVKAGLPTDSIDTVSMYETVQVDVFVAALADSGITPIAPAAPAVQADSVTVTTSATVLNTDQTVVELGKNGKGSMLQVISVPNDPNTIDEIVYTDKNHTDIYNVKAGMTGHETRKLRREMKHMVRKGKVFMYEDDSNIMYQMTATDAVTKDSYTDDEVDNMTVDSIIWKNNKQSAKKKK